MVDAYRLDGQTALITGGGSGIGKATCVLFAEAGADVAVVDLRGDDAKATARQVEELGRRSLAIACDVSDLGEVQSAVDQVMAEFGKIDMLCNVAGLAMPPSAFVDSKPENWRIEMDVNFFGCALLTRTVLPHMLAAGGGRIVNTASDAARVGEPFSAVYAAAKAAVIGFSKSVAKEVARANVRVNCISPGATHTRLAERAGISPEAFEKVVKAYPLRRLGEPEDQAQAILYLASPASDWVTGQTLSISGGFTMA
jgi:NAD(P)-dependent dehydrogenase (short-subunit alcohol dehydrogenase family)